MTAKKKWAFATDLREEWATALLGELRPPLDKAREELAILIKEGQQALMGNPLTPLVAKAAAKSLGRVGDVTLVIDELGNVLLVGKTPKKQRARTKRKWADPLPILTVLRKQADTLGLDWKPYGKSRIRLREAIADHEDSRPEVEAPEVFPAVEDKPTATKKPRKKMVKTAPAISQPKQVKPEDLPFDPATQLPDDLGDIPEDVPDQPEPPPKPPKKKPKVNLVALSAQAEALDVDDLLADLTPEEAPPAE